MDLEELHTRLSRVMVLALKTRKKTLAGEARALIAALAPEPHRGAETKEGFSRSALSSF
jgi:hypothetical protein